jgi:hypothetical protein
MRDPANTLLKALKVMRENSYRVIVNNEFGITTEYRPRF